MLRAEDFADPNEKMGMAAFRFLEEKVITEESTDAGIEFLSNLVGELKVLKWLPAFIKRRILKDVLDKLLPEKILDLIWFLMLKVRVVDPEDKDGPRDITMKADFPDFISPK